MYTYETYTYTWKRACAHTENIHARTHTNIQHWHTRTGENPLTTIYVNIKTCNHNYIIILIVIYDHYFTILSYTVVSRVVPNRFRKRVAPISQENSLVLQKRSWLEKFAVDLEIPERRGRCGWTRENERTFYNVVQILVFRDPYFYICMIYIDTTRRIDRREWGRESSRSRWRATEHY